MNNQHIFGRPVGLAAAATLVLGLATAGTAHAASPHQPYASVAHDTLLIRGTNSDDAIQVQVATGDPNSLLVDFGHATLPQSFDRRTFAAIAVFLRGGNDQFHVVPGGGSLVEDALTVDGGSGRDTIVGGDGNDTLSGGPGGDNIQGGDGNDLIFGRGGNDLVDGNRGTDTEILGTGADSAVWNPGEGNDVIEGGTGSDTLVFNGASAAETMSLSANGTHAVFLRDIGAIRMDLHGVEALNLATLGGADAVTINDLSGTYLRHANIDLSAQGAGDGAADTVTVNGTDQADRIHVDAYHGTVDVSGLPVQTRISGSERTDHLQVNGLGGHDRAHVSRAASALIGVSVDLGTGQR